MFYVDKIVKYFTQAARFKSELEQERLQLQRQHSSDMEQMLDKVSGSNIANSPSPQVYDCTGSEITD